MARFDVYPNPAASERRHTPYLLDVQNNYLDLIETTVVVPLCSADAMPLRARDLNPALSVKGRQVILNTAEIGAIPTRLLRAPVAHLGPSQADIQTALDTLFGGH
ncbi:MAG: CcdB family protein [Ramlibacter sp.]|nr:CcdB family protein [Ramlibacter sp.]